MGRTVRPQQPIAAVKRFRSEYYLRPALQRNALLHRPAGKFFNFEASTASAAKYAAIPASTTAIKRSKRQAWYPMTTPA
mgnify:CR=1 FL=1